LLDAGSRNALETTATIVALTGWDIFHKLLVVNTTKIVAIHCGKFIHVNTGDMVKAEKFDPLSS
jgi:ribosomal protein S17